MCSLLLKYLISVFLWTPNPSKKESDIPKNIPLEELGVSIDADNLSDEQLFKLDKF